MTGISSSQSRGMKAKFGETLCQLVTQKLLAAMYAFWLRKLMVFYLTKVLLAKELTYELLKSCRS